LKKIYNLYSNLKLSNNFQRILSGSFWNAILNFWNKGISFTGTIIIIRIIGREAFGEFGMLNSTVAMFGMFTTFSISQTATKYIAEYRISNKDKAGKIIGLSFLFSTILGFLIFLLVFFLAESLANQTLNSPHLKKYIQLMSIGLLFGSINGAQNGVIAGFESFKSNAILTIFTSTFLTILKVILAYFYGFYGAIIGMCLEPIILFLSSLYLTNKTIKLNKIKVNYKNAFNESKIFLNYSLPSLLVGIIVFPVNWYIMTLLAKTNSGYYELGGFNAANQWFNVLIFIPYILASTFLPVFSSLISENKPEAVDRIIKNAVFILLIIFIPLTLIFTFFGNNISLIIYGGEFSEIGFLLAVSVFTMIPQGISIILGNLLGALDKMWFSFWMHIFWGIISIASAFWFLHLGALGLLYAKLISFTFNVIVMFTFYIQWKNKFKIAL
jgi:O-antigen/teichoic acid export membrane protein